MQLSLSDDQRLIEDSLARLLRDSYGFDARRKVLASERGMSRTLWAGLAEMGLLGLPFAEADGGAGGSAFDLMVVMEQLGRALVVEPYWASVVLAGGVLDRAARAPAHRALLAALASGESLLAFAHGEPGARYDLARVATTAAAVDGGYVLSGRKGVVPWGGAADFLIVTARTAGGVADRDGLSLFLLAREAAGLAVRDYPTVDGHRAAELALDGVRLPAEALIGEPGGALAAVERAADLAIAALVAEAVGAMAALVDGTREYLRTRKQFGVPIASFQVLQHRMVEMAMAVELTRSMAFVAAGAVADEDAAARRKAIAAAKVQAGRAGRFVGQQAVQLHGGMGMTDEMPVGHYFKRLTAIDALLGDADHHLERFAAA